MSGVWIVEWVNVTDQIYQGGIVNSAVGVGSVCIKDNWLYYIFGGEDFLNPWSIGDNNRKYPYVHDGHPADLYCFRVKIKQEEFVSRILSTEPLLTERFLLLCRRQA